MKNLSKILFSLFILAALSFTSCDHDPDLLDEITVTYKVTTVYSPEHDAGIRWDSVGIEWPDINPIISDRDSNLPSFNDFITPFK